LPKYINENYIAKKQSVKTEKTTIKNRDGTGIVVLIDIAENPKGLAFVMHGNGGTKEQKHIAAFASAFSESNYTVVRFDARNSLGESGGKYENATATSHFEDLEDVISWAKSQAFYAEPFCLAGHSIGAMSAGLYAENYPEEIKSLILVSAIVSGKIYIDSFPKEELEEYRKTGWKISESKTAKPGTIKKLNWNNYESDMVKQDLLPNAANLKMPVLLIVGDKDDKTIPEQQKMLLEKLSGKKELHIIKDGPHTFIDKKQIEEIKAIMKKWIGKI